MHQYLCVNPPRFHGHKGAGPTKNYIQFSIQLKYFRITFPYPVQTYFNHSVYFSGYDLFHPGSQPFSHIYMRAQRDL